MAEFYEPPGRPRIGVGCWIAMGLALGIVGYIVVVNIRCSIRASNESAAAGYLKVLANAEAEFRERDLDYNGVQDFWTGDVAGLHRFGAIERELAQADAEPLQPIVSQPIPCRGYFFRALDKDESDTPAGPYRQDTDKKSGNVHHRSKFGFVAYPAQPEVSGSYVYIVNENNTIVRKPTSGSPPPRHWPSDTNFRTWYKFQ